MIRLLIVLIILLCSTAQSAFFRGGTAVAPNIVIPGAYSDANNGAPAGSFEQPMEAFEAWLGYTTDALYSVAYSPYAFDCVGGGTACFTNTSNFYNGGTFWFPNSRQKIVWSLALTGCDHAVNIVSTTQCSGGHTIPLNGASSVASGFEDSAFNTAIATIAGAWPNAIIRLGWEMNLSSTGTWGVGGTGGSTSTGVAYVAAFQHVAGLIQVYNTAHSTHLLIDWCPNIGLQNSAPTENFYPGDSYVDIIGLDFYDSDGQGFNYYRTLNYGLNWHASFAATHRKNMAFDEWGCGGSDSTDANCANIISGMHTWFASHPALYFNFWNSQSATTLSKQICNNGTAGTCGAPYQNPLSEAAFCSAFKGASSAAC